ncbi:MAG: sulfurtransferase TusA family protein [Nitrospiria bacterium]
MTPPNALQENKDTTGKIPHDLLTEIESFESQVEKVRQGKISVDQFRPFRLQHGIYGQRQTNVQMFRIKIPFGGLNAEQMDRLAEIAENYTNGILHTTTRQDIQLHWISLYKCGEIMRKITEVGLTTREACGNTIRNVTGCHKAGVCSSEAFDITPYAGAISKHFLRNPVCQSMPRKFKISFSGCATACALPGIHDIGLIAQKRVSGDQKEILGFKIFVGGGLGAMPRAAHLLEDFVPTSELTRVCESIVRVFDRFGNRKNRNRARLKFVIDKLGMTQFNKLYRQEYEKLAQKTELNFKIPAHLEGGGAGSPVTENGHSKGLVKSEGTGYENWLSSNVEPQKQPGFSTVQVRLILGDIHASEFRQLAEITRRFAGGNLRITINQNLMLRWVKNETLPQVYEALKKAGLEKAGAETLSDIVSCPGADTCGIAITSSKQMASALAKSLTGGPGSDSDYAGIRIKISGCQNSCGQHHMAPIGLHGVSKTIGEHTAPFYELHLGGRDSIEGTTFAKAITKIPAKNVPLAVEKVLSLYRDKRRNDESFVEFTDRFGKKGFTEELKELIQLPAFDDKPQYYYDWGGTREFEVIDLGPGECAGGADAMIKTNFDEAESELAIAKEQNQNQQGSFALSKGYRALVAAIKGMLILKGLEPATDTEAFQAFNDHYISKGAFAGKFADFNSLVERLERGGHPSSSEVSLDISNVGHFLEECRILYALSDSESKQAPLNGGHESEDAKATRQIETAKKEAVAEAEEIIEIVPTAKMDLRGVKCPINFVRTKLKLEMMEPGEILEVLLDEGEPANNVPRSVKDEGNQVMKLAQIDNYFKLVIKKT